MVLVVGQGSGGSLVDLELAKSGVMNFNLVDHDRLEVGNVARHVAGLSHVGRYKTKVMADLIREKNPYATVGTWEEKVSWKNAEEVRDLVRKADIIICATDERQSKLVINRLCVEEKKPCIFGGAFRRAYGGQVLLVRPYESPCYQCFLMLLPDQAGDEEISSREQAEGLAYTDRPVPIEPGLSTDIAPISIMVVKLVIQELLKGRETTFRSLDDDLKASWYLWLNRREPGTQYERLQPLEFNVGGMHILRWYGVDVKQHPACPVCGKFEDLLATQRGVEPLIVYD
jgi:molybdopterin/thiamine biosynthesis adenylyltransferase